MASPLIDELRNILATSFASGVSGAAAEIDQNLQRAAASDGKAGELAAARNFFAANLSNLERALADTFRKRFSEKLAGETGQFSKTQSFSLDSLSLVEDTDVDENILIANTGKRLRDDCEYELFAISRRLEILMDVEHLEDSNNPASPRTFCRAFFVAMAAIDASPAIRAHVFNAAKAALTRILQTTYQNANEFLMNHGVLIEITQRYGKPILQAESRVAPASASAAASATASATSPTAPVQTAAAPSASVGVATATPNVFGPRHGGALARRRDKAADDMNALLAQLLSQYGLDQPRGSANAPAPAPAPDATVRLGAFDGAVGAGSGSEALITDLVTRSFDAMFATPELSDPLKAQIARLQLPVLQATLLDTSLLTDGSHSLRILIDQLGDLGRRRGASLQPGDAAFERLRTLLQYLLSALNADALAMTDVNEQLQDMIEADDDAAQHAIDDLRVRQLEEERSAHAFAIADYEIQRRLAAPGIPDVVRLFANKAWRWLLMIDFLAEGEDSEDWKKDIATLDDLLWSVTPGAASDPRLPVLILQLVGRLNEALNRAGVARTERVAFYNRLAEIHRDVLDPATNSNSRRATAALAAASGAAETLVDPRSIRPQRSLKLTKGAWLRTRIGGVGAQLCQVLWISPMQERYILRNYSAVDAREANVLMQADELDEAFKRGTLSVLDNAPLSQRSIEAAVRDMLQSKAAD